MNYEVEIINERFNITKNETEERVNLYFSVSLKVILGGIYGNH